LVELVSALPGNRPAAVDQFVARVGEERQELLQELSEAEPGLRAVLADLQPVLESIERTVTLAKTRNPDAKPFDINDYTEIVSEAAVTAAELRLLIQSVRELLAGSSDAAPLLGAVVEAERTIVDRLFWQLVVLIIVFFAALLGYLYIAGRFFPKQ